MFRLTEKQYWIFLKSKFCIINGKIDRFNDDFASISKAPPFLICTVFIVLKWSRWQKSSDHSALRRQVDNLKKNYIAHFTFPSLFLQGQKLTLAIADRQILQCPTTETCCEPILTFLMFINHPALGNQHFTTPIKAYQSPCCRNLLWVHYFTKTTDSLITLLQKSALENQPPPPIYLLIDHPTTDTCSGHSRTHHVIQHLNPLITLLQKPAPGN